MSRSGKARAVPPRFVLIPRQLISPAAVQHRLAFGVLLIALQVMLHIHDLGTADPKPGPRGD